MRTFLIALASAPLLTYIVVEAMSKFFPNQDNYLALAVAVAVALFINGLFNARLAASDTGPKRQRNGARKTIVIHAVTAPAKVNATTMKNAAAIIQTVMVKAMPTVPPSQTPPINA